MSSNSQFFMLQDSLRVSKKKPRKQKNKKEEPRQETVSLSFYDDLQPIQLSGSYGITYNLSISEENNSFDYGDGNSNSFSQQEWPVYEEQQSIDVMSFDHEASLKENDIFLLQEENTTTNKPGSLSDYDIANDLSAILAADGAAKPIQSPEVVPQNENDFIKQALEKNKTMAEKKPDETATTEAPETPATSENKHAIFDAIAKSMNYANAFDLGDFSLEQKFDLFDEETDKKKATGKNENTSIKVEASPSTPVEEKKTEDLVTTKNFIEDLDIISEEAKSLSATPDKKTTTWPSVPADLEQPSATKTKQLFGEFEFEDVAGSDSCEIKIKGTWAADNIEAVDIPQLKGKINGSTGKEISKGVINFNKKAKNQLQKLWKAWEDAGLLDRIITYDGGFVPRHIKKKGGGCGTSLSNHAWGTAFDINAATNGLGVEPPLVGEKGCTRELVEIANKHGFYWGGHYTTKDGMHFEVAKIIE